MFKILFALNLMVGHAGDVVSLNRLGSNDHRQAALTFLQSRDFSTQQKSWKRLEAMQPSGLSYVDDVLKILRDNSHLWPEQTDKGPLLLGSLIRAIDQTEIPENFFSSAQGTSIHNSLKWLLKCYNRPEIREHAITLYNKLHLWDESDLMELMRVRNSHQELTGVLIEMVSQGSDYTKKAFARRLYYNPGNLIELMLLYRIRQIKPWQLESLLNLLMRDNANRTQTNPDPWIYGENNWRLVQDLRNEVLSDLHQQLKLRDETIVQAYTQLYDSLAKPSLVISNPQKRAYRKFLLQLKSGLLNSCESSLFVIPDKITDPGDRA